MANGDQDPSDTDLGQRSGLGRSEEAEIDILYEVFGPGNVAPDQPRGVPVSVADRRVVEGKELWLCSDRPRSHRSILPRRWLVAAHVM